MTDTGVQSSSVTGDQPRPGHGDDRVAGGEDPLDDGRAVYRERRRVEWVDTDAGGRIHFSAVFRWAESAEFSLLRQVHAPTLTNFPRRHVDAVYHKALHFGDEFDMEITTARIGRTSVVYRWRGFKDGELYIEGTMTGVHVDEEGRAAKVPESLRAGLLGGAARRS
jgi:acyl-CoA thioesterase FadM